MKLESKILMAAFAVAMFFHPSVGHSQVAVEKAITVRDNSIENKIVIKDKIQKLRDLREQLADANAQLLHDKIVSHLIYDQLNAEIQNTEKELADALDSSDNSFWEEYAKQRDSSRTSDREILCADGGC